MIDAIVRYEDKLIKDLYYSQHQSFDGLFEAEVPDKSAPDIADIAERVHYRLINSLIYTYLYKHGLADADEIMRAAFDSDSHADYEILDFVNCVQIPEVCGALHEVYLNTRFTVKRKGVERVKSKHNLIENGAVYTSPVIAREIVENALGLCTMSRDIAILDFACGTGRFYEALVDELHMRYSFAKQDIILNNIFAVDIDPVAVKVTRLKALSYLDPLKMDKVEKVCGNILLRDALAGPDTLFDSFKGLSGDDFGGKVNRKFDAIVSNPPYLVLKPDRSKLNDSKGMRILKMASYFRNCNLYRYSIEGMLNLYQLSIERMIGILKPQGVLGVICPATLFADVSATKLRRFLLKSNCVLSIKKFDEDAALFDNVTQATNIFYMRKGGETGQIDINIGGHKFIVDMTLVEKLFSKNLEIPMIPEYGWNILKKIACLQPLKSISNVRNRRGELDLTLSNRFITKSKTPYRLVRGNMLAGGSIVDINHEYVEEDFIKTRSSEYMLNDFNRKRLVCQQVSNGRTSRRLRFMFCEETDILGNSCNYISSDYDTLKKLNMILNSSVLNWRFKVTSSNNHINNYELGELPIISLDLVDCGKVCDNQEAIDYYIGALYGLNEEEIRFVSQ